MAGILEALASLQKTPVPVFLVVAGILLLLLGFVEQIGAVIRLPSHRRTSAIVTGVLLLICGAWLFILPTVAIRPGQAQNSSEKAASSSVASVSQVLAVEPGGAHPIYKGKLSPGYDMAGNTSGGVTTWVHQDTSGVCMEYPHGQDWGAIFVTVGKPRTPPRPSRDLSTFKRIAVELRGGSGGESVAIGIKSSSDPDDGSETKMLVEDLTKYWTHYEWPLSEFSTADLHRIYVPVEFVFEGPGKTVCFRNVSYLP